MNYNIQFVGTKTSEKIKELTVKKLDTLVQKFNWTCNASVFFKKEMKDPVNGSICEIKLSGPGPLIFASSNEQDFEKALNETIRDLTVQLKKRKDIMKDREKVSYKSV